MIRKYGKIIIEEENIIISGWGFEGEGRFDAIEWAKKRLDGETSESIQTKLEGKRQPTKKLPTVLPV